MATLTAHMAELDAVNEILSSIGETAVNSFESGLPAAGAARTVLGRVSREIQLVGWHQNFLEGYEISVDSNDNIPLPVNTLSVKTVTPIYRRKDTTPPISGHIRASMRRSADDTQFILWDNDNNRETWPNLTSVAVDLTLFLEFKDLTPALQAYITHAAGHRYQKGNTGSQVLFEFTKEDLDTAMAVAVQEDADTTPLNIIYDAPSVNAAVVRRNPLFGR